VRAEGERRRLLVLRAGRRGADVGDVLILVGLLLRYLDRPPGLHVDARGPVGVLEGRRREQLAGVTVVHVDEAGASELDQHLARLAVDRQVDDDVLVDVVVVPLIVRRRWVGPERFTGPGVAGEGGGGPEIVARPEIGIPHAGVARPIVDPVQLGIVTDPAPYTAATALPLARRPRLDAEIGSLEPIVERLEPRPDEHVLVGPAVVRLPELLATGKVEGGDPTAHAQLAAAVAHEDAAIHDQRRHRHGLPGVDVAELGFPQDLPGRRVERHRHVVEPVEHQLALGVGGAAIHHIAAGLPLRGRIGGRVIAPLERAARVGEVDGVDDVRVGRHDVHRVVHYEGRTFVAAVEAG
jgi:hypothetical protein